MRILPLVIAVLCLAAPASAFADAFDDVFADYQKDGRIDACKHSDDALKSARRQIPNDIEQYAPDFPDALDQALERRARGDCDKKAAETAAQPTTSTPTPPAGEDAGTAPAAQTTPGAAPSPPGTATAASVASDGL